MNFISIFSLENSIKINSDSVLYIFTDTRLAYKYKMLMIKPIILFKIMKKSLKEILLKIYLLLQADFLVNEY